MSTCNNILIPRGLFQSILITWLDKTTSALLGKDVGLYVPLYSSVRLSGMHTIFSRWKDRRARQHWPRKSTTWKFRSKSYISIYMCVCRFLCIGSRGLTCHVDGDIVETGSSLSVPWDSWLVNIMRQRSWHFGLMLFTSWFSTNHQY